MRTKFLALIFAIALVGGGGTALAGGPPAFVGQPPAAPAAPPLSTPFDCDSATDVVAEEVSGKPLVVCPGR